MEIRTHIEIGHSLNLDASKKKLLKDATRYMVSSTEKKITAGRHVPNSPLTRNLKNSSKPLNDTGALLISINGRVEGDCGIIGTNHVAARILQEGGTIRAKGRTGLLWIPASKKVKNEVRTRGSVGNAILKYRTSGYSVYRRGNAFFAKKKGSDEKPIMLFILKPLVHIPARPYLYFSDEDEKILMAMMRNDVMEESGR